MNAFLEFNRSMIINYAFLYGASFGIVGGLIETHRGNHSIYNTWWLVLKMGGWTGLTFVAWRHGMLVIDRLELMNWSPMKLPLLLDFVRAKTKSA